MPHVFTEYPHDPEPQPSSSRGKQPPGKGIGTDLLDPPNAKAPLHIDPPNAKAPWHISFWWGIVLLAGALLALLFVGRVLR